MQSLLLLIKGFLIGLAKIIPGVSGAVLAITFGIYDKCLEAITKFFDNKKENIRLLLPLGIGALAAILLASKLVKFSLENYYFITMLFFLGLIIGGIPPLFKEIKNKKNYVYSLILGIIILSLSFLNTENTYVLGNNQVLDTILLFFVGIIEALSMLVPGLSGTALLMLIGFYDIIINTLSNLTNLELVAENLNILIPYTIGLIIGIIVIAKIMSYLFTKCREKTYAGIIGLTIATTAVLIRMSLTSTFNVPELFLGILLCGSGYIIANKLG